MKCKHKFRTLSNAAGGWKTKPLIVQCDKCDKVYKDFYNGFWQVEIHDEEGEGL